MNYTIECAKVLDWTATYDGPKLSGSFDFLPVQRFVQRCVAALTHYLQIVHAAIIMV